MNQETSKNATLLILPNDLKDMNMISLTAFISSLVIQKDKKCAEMQINLFRRIILFSLLLFSAGHIKAQEENEKIELSYLGFNPSNRLCDTSLADDIDSILYNCPDGLGRTTIGDMNCYQEAITLTEKKINRAYEELYKKLDSTDKKLLKATQDRWNSYFKAEKEFLFSAFYTWSNYQKYGHGREHSIAQAEWIFKLARQRLIAIRAFSKEI